MRRKKQFAQRMCRIKTAHNVIYFFPDARAFERLSKQKSTQLENEPTQIHTYMRRAMEKEPSDFNTTLEQKARPFDYQEIIDSRMFRSALTWFRSNRLVDIRLRISSIKKNQELIELIEKELKK